MRRIWAIAHNTFREAIRKKLLIVVGLFALCIAATLWLLPTINEQEARVALVEQMSLGLMSFLSTVVAVFLAAWSIPSEIEARQIYSVVTKPVSRLEVLIGKLLGFCLILGLMLALMTVLGLAAIRFASSRAEVSTLLAKPIAPNRMEVSGIGEGKWVDGQLSLTIPDTTDVGEKWELPISGNPPEEIVSESAVLLVDWIAGKPYYYPSSEEELAQLMPASIELQGLDATGKLLWKDEQDVQFKLFMTTPSSPSERPRLHLVTKLKIPSTAAESASICATLLTTDPAYAPPVIRRYSKKETIRWSFEGVPEGVAAASAKGMIQADVTVSLRSGLYGTGSRSVDVFFEVANPVSHRSSKVQAKLKDDRPGSFSFPAYLLRDGQVDITYLGNAENLIIALRTVEPSLTLRGKPVLLELGYVKATLLIFGQLLLIVAVTAMIATVASGPVSVLVALTTWIAGASAGFVKEYVAIVESHVGPVVKGGHVHGTQPLEGLVGHIVNSMLRIEAVVLPDFARYSVSPFIISGHDVPSGFMLTGLAQTAIFVVAATVVGWVIFRAREFK